MATDEVYVRRYVLTGFTMLKGTPISIAVAPVDWWRRVIVTRAALLLTLWQRTTTR